MRRLQRRLDLVTREEYCSTSKHLQYVGTVRSYGDRDLYQEAQRLIEWCKMMVCVVAREPVAIVL
jgi:hypothetical protein